MPINALESTLRSTPKTPINQLVFLKVSLNQRLSTTLHSHAHLHWGKQRCCGNQALCKHSKIHIHYFKSIMSKENPCFVHEENMYKAQHYLSTIPTYNSHLNSHLNSNFLLSREEVWNPPKENFHIHFFKNGNLYGNYKWEL